MCRQLAARAAVALLTCALLLVPSGRADAQVYKYTKPDGTVVFTDKLSDLPAERRAHYTKKEEAAARRRKEQLERMTPEERREAELALAREKVLEKEAADAARARQLLEIDRALGEIRETQTRQEQKRRIWRDKRLAAEASLAEALAAWEAARREWESLAIKAGYALFPGQQERLLELQEKILPELEARVDAANTYLTDTLPEEARRAGAPPGWQRR